MTLFLVFFLAKDVARTDRNLDYFQGDDNIHLRILHDVLMTYNMFNFDLGLRTIRFFFERFFVCFLSLGYVQGMNDLLSPILIIMEDEVDAFWCFAGLMSRMVNRKKNEEKSNVDGRLGTKFSSRSIAHQTSIVESSHFTSVYRC